MTNVACRCDGPCGTHLAIGEVAAGLYEPKVPVQILESWDGVPTVWLNATGIDDLIAKLAEAKANLQPQERNKP